MFLIIAQGSYLVGISGPRRGHPGDIVSEEMRTKPDSAWFAHHLRRALVSLYDPSVLRNSPLLGLFDVQERGNAVPVLQRALANGIESLKPNENTPPGSRARRIYQVLRGRYTEQLTQQEVAADLGLSIRQLKREEKAARQVLADRLWAVYDLEARAEALSAASSRATGTHIPTRIQELEFLRNSVPVQMIRIEKVIEDVLATIDPLLKSSGVRVEYAPCENMPSLFLQMPILCQALLNVVSTAVECARGGQVRIQTGTLPSQVCVHVQAYAQRDVPFTGQRSHTEALAMAEQLVQLCRGFLTVERDVEGQRVFAAQIALPVAEQVIVLSIDDNADTLQLFKRYLTGTRYRFVGAQDAQRGFKLAEQLAPRIIVLDVMMPEQDGWALLGQLREHPQTRGCPVIVCTILPQGELALALGAAEFIRKPVARTALLSALDRQLDLMLRESRSSP